MSPPSSSAAATLTFVPSASAYVPILLDMRGELRALASLDERSWAATRPLIQVRPPELRTESGAGKPVDVLIDEMVRRIGTHSIYLDPAGLRRERNAVHATRDFVDQVFASASGLLSFRPVYPTGRPDLIPAVLAYAARGAMIRVRLDEAFDLGLSVTGALEREIEPLRNSRMELELLLDLGYIAPDMTASAAPVVRLVEQLTATGWFTTVAIGGTSVPKSISEHVNELSINGVRRQELGLYAEAARTLPGLRLGDYGVQHALSPDPVHAANMVASARYTAGDYVLFSRGKGPVLKLGRAEKVAQYQAIAERIVAHPWFVGEEACCVADGIMEDCADGTTGIATQQGWRYVGTRHHIPTVLRDLARIRGRDLVSRAAGGPPRDELEAVTPTNAVPTAPRP